MAKALKSIFAVLSGILFAATIGLLYETKPSPPFKKESFASVVEAKETKTPFVCRIKRMKVTAYCPCEKCCGQFADGKTSIGRDAQRILGVAADPKVLPYGTKLKIPGLGLREVDDTGGAMRQSTKQGICHVDVRFHNHDQAKKFGVQWLDVEILN